MKLVAAVALAVCFCIGGGGGFRHAGRPPAPKVRVTRPAALLQRQRPAPCLANVCYFVRGPSGAIPSV